MNTPTQAKERLTSNSLREITRRKPNNPTKSTNAGRKARRLKQNESQSLRSHFGKVSLSDLADPKAKPKKRDVVVKNPHKVTRKKGEDVLASKEIGDIRKMTTAHFTYLKVLGQGTYGIVHLVRNKSNHALYALKTLGKRQQIDEQEVDHVINESRILQGIDFPLIVNHHASFQDDDNLHILMEFVQGCDLHAYITETNGFKEPLIKFFAAQIVVILEYLHDQHIVFRDLKPENLLVDVLGFLKLTDFSFAKKLENRHGRTETFCGTPCYVAPEVILQEGHGLCVDWWSLGVLIYEMVTGEPPFNNEGIVELYDDVLTNDVRFDQRFSLPLQSILTELLLKDPRHRLGAAGAAEVRSHPFFNEVNWDGLVEKTVKSPLSIFLIEAVKQGRTVDVEPHTTLVPLTDEEQKLFEGFSSTSDTTL